MRSRVDVRVALEWAARALLLAVLAWLAWSASRPGVPDHVERASQGTLSQRLSEWTRTAPRALDVTVQGAPSALQRDWLDAFRRVGTSVAWRANSPLGVAVADERPAEPGDWHRVSLASADSGSIRIADDVGLIDTAHATGGGSAVLLPAARGEVRAAVAGDTARAAPRDSVDLRPVLVIGRAGWESKFVLAALEESGWKAAAAMDLRPDASVTQGDIATIDTARLSAVVALDSTAARYAESIARFVASGGGLVLGAEAASLSPLRALASAQPAPTLIPPGDPATTRTQLALRPLVPTAGAAILERRGAAAAIAAGLAGQGRVVTIGYEDTWRWRMAAGAADHRLWWSHVVGSVARPVIRHLAHGSPDDAPYARALMELGPPSSPAVSRESPVPASSPWLLALSLMLVVAELVSRRLRGGR